MSLIKSPAEIALMREAGRVVANTLERVREAAAVGVSLQELDQLAAATIFMAVFVTAFSLMTDALRDALDPKLRGLE